MMIEEAKKLSPEEINRLIALAMGWKDAGRASGIMIPPESKRRNNLAFDYPPDYFHDLNECHEAEKWIVEHSAVFRYIEQMHEQHKVNSEWEDDADELIMAPANVRAIALACVLSERKK
jgi:hypothetical protein